MKCTIILLISALIGLCAAVSQPVIPNTAAEGCVDGVCGQLCSWDGAKIFPGDELNQPGKCRMLRCTKNFEIRITPCPFDMLGEYEWINPDKTKLYPDCCGTKVKRNRN